MRNLLNKHSKRGFKFLQVGIVTTLLDWGIFFALFYVLGVHYLFSLVCGITIGGMANYILNKIYSFKSKSKQYVKQYATHVSVMLVGLMISVVTMFLFVDGGLEEGIARVITTGLVFFYNYMAHSKFTYSKKWDI